MNLDVSLGNLLSAIVIAVSALGVIQQLRSRINFYGEKQDLYQEATNKRMNAIEKKVDDIHTTVHNGLTEKFVTRREWELSMQKRSRDANI